MNPNLRADLTIPAAHPALPGHFPGRPVVPGALILSEVAGAAVRLLDATRVTGLVFVKFSSPMLPEERCEVAFTREGADTATFEVTRGGTRVVSGRLQYETSVAR